MRINSWLRSAERIFPGIRRIVKLLLKSTGITVAAAIAYIRRFQQSATDFSLKIFTEGIAHVASFAELVIAGSMAGRAEVALSVFETEDTRVIMKTHVSDFTKYKVGTYFAGNTRRVFVQNSSNVFKGSLK